MRECASLTITDLYTIMKLTMMQAGLQKPRFLKNFFRFLRFLPVRRYASAGNSHSNVSVRLSVRLPRAGIVSKRRKLAS